MTHPHTRVSPPDEPSTRHLWSVHQPEPGNPQPATPQAAPLATSKPAALVRARPAVVDVREQARVAVARARAELPELDPAVYRCYLGDLVEAVKDGSEADPIAVLASLIAAAGVHLGPDSHLMVGDDRHPLLVWPLIVGRTNSGRKGTSWSTTRRLITAADPEFASTNIQSGLTSGEGLAALFIDLDPHNPNPTNPGDQDSPATQPGRKPDKNRPIGHHRLLPPGDTRLLVYEPEWAAVMARMRREGNSLSATLRAAWEGGNLSTLTVTARVAPVSHIGLVAHITPAEFREKIQASDLAGGTYNRFLPIAVARSKFLAHAPGIDPEQLRGHGTALASRLAQAAQIGQLGFTPTAAHLWEQLYVEFGADEATHGPVEQFISRAAPNCLRIAAIHAALDQRQHINTDDLTAAAALVRYSINSARAVFTDTTLSTRLAAWIADAGTTGRTREEIRKDFFSGNQKASQINGWLDQLTETGAITRAKRPRADGRPGRATEVFTATPMPP